MSPEEEALFEAVVAQLDDDRPRQVLADYLTEKGDPRGELIALQLVRAKGHETEVMRRREAQLMAENRERFLAPLAGMAREVGMTFERGFLVRAKLQHALHAHPHVRLLEEVHFTEGGLDPDARLDALRHARGIPLAQVQRLFAAAPRLRRLELTRFEMLEAVSAALQPFPESVQEVSLHVVNPFDVVLPRLLAEPVGRALTELTALVDLPALNVKQVEWTLNHLPGGLTRLQLHHSEGEQWVLTRERNAWRLKVRMVRGDVSPRQAELFRAIAALPMLGATVISRASPLAALEQAAPSMRGKIEWVSG